MYEKIFNGYIDQYGIKPNREYESPEETGRRLSRELMDFLGVKGDFVYQTSIKENYNKQFEYTI